MMRGVALGAMAAVLALAGCATARSGGSGDGAAEGAETIRYRTSRCFGTCPVYSVTVAPDGRGMFEGQMYTAVTGPRSFEATPAQYRGFADALRAVRPETPERLVVPGQPECGAVATDMPSVEVQWTAPSGTSRRLVVYYGCFDAGPWRERLHGAPASLPIDGFIGPRPATR